MKDSKPEAKAGIRPKKAAVLVLILIAALAVLGTVMALIISRSKSKTDEKPALRDASGNFAGGSFFSAENGRPLDPNDPDYVAVSGKGFDIFTAVATDDLGRTLPADGTGDNGRQVALFYNINHFGGEGTEIFQNYLDSGKPLGAGKSYWWGKPLYGFYCSDDTWVTRRHIEMFIYAGVDYLVFDTTNGSAYTESALKLMRLLHEYNEAGWKAPKVVFYTNTDSLNTMMAAYTDIYEPGKYRDTWYMVDGKPLIIGSQTSPAIEAFFTLRRSQWPNSEKVPGGYPWIDFKDVADIYYDENGKHGVVPVSTAQNCSPNAWFSDNVLYGMTGETGGSRGRSWHGGKDSITEDSYKYGYNFQEEWDRAIASDAETAMVLQWNEWRAGVWPTNGKLAIFDEFTAEYSRDTEPMSGGYFDNYYMQLAANIRRFKNTGGTLLTSQNKTVDIAGGLGQWNRVDTVYIDMASTERRDNQSFSKDRLTDDSGRNGMVCAKVAKDASNLYFYVQTLADISDDREGTWMNLYIDTDGDLLNNWNGYEYRVNGVASDGKLRLEKYNAGGFEQTAEVPFRMRGNQLMLSLPKSVLGISGDDYTLNFKWADSRTLLETREDFYLHGDTMPFGRFNYAFNAAKDGGTAFTIPAPDKAARGPQAEYIPDLNGGISDHDPDWELLHTAYAEGGKLTGSVMTESGLFGIGFKHKTSGRGTTVITADITVPVPEGNKSGFVEIALRLNDFTDNKTEKKGVRIGVDGSGQIGIAASSGRKFTSQKTRFTFAEGRKIYIEDNADTNVITVYVDDAGEKVKVADCVISGRNVTMYYAEGGLPSVMAGYSYDIYPDGYISITSGARYVSVSDISVKLP